MAKTFPISEHYINIEVHGPFGFGLKLTLKHTCTFTGLSLLGEHVYNYRNFRFKVTFKSI